MPKPGWFKVVRTGLEFLRLVRDQTTPVCPNENCPLKLNKASTGAVVEMSQGEKIKHHKDLYRRNHPDE